MTDPNRRLDQLETRLEQYFEHLEESLDQRDKFAVSAAWGIVKATTGLATAAAVYYACTHWLHLTGWLGGMVAMFAAFIGYAAGVAWQETGEKRDHGKLYRLPVWRRRD